MAVTLPGDGCTTLLRDGIPVHPRAFPEIGRRARAKVTKSTFTQAMLRIFEVEGQKTAIEYRAVLRPAEFNTNEFICDRVRKGDVIDCVIVSYGDAGIFVSV
jgi:exosome complex RNA-binding protein Csl4